MNTKTLITIAALAIANGLFLGSFPLEISGFLSACMVGLAYALGEHNAKK